MGIEYVFVVLESACRKTKEWNCPVGFASVGLKKAFDRIQIPFGSIATTTCAKISLRSVVELVPEPTRMHFRPGSFWHWTWCPKRWCDQPTFFQRKPGTRTTAMETNIENQWVSNWCRSKIDKCQVRWWHHDPCEMSMDELWWKLGWLVVFKSVANRYLHGSAKICKAHQAFRKLTEICWESLFNKVWG